MSALNSNAMKEKIKSEFKLKRLPFPADFETNLEACLEAKKYLLFVTIKLCLIVAIIIHILENYLEPKVSTT